MIFVGAAAGGEAVAMGILLGHAVVAHVLSKVGE